MRKALILVQDGQISDVQSAELEADWRGVTGQHPDEIMLSLVDETLFAELFQSSQQRLTLAGRLKLISKMLRAMLGARLGKQAIIVIPNL